MPIVGSELLRQLGLPLFLWRSRRLGHLVFILTLLPALIPWRTWAEDEQPKLVSTTDRPGRQPFKNLAELQKAAATGNPGACLQLGLRYETGEDVKQDYAQARSLYEQAAAAGRAEAIYRLGRVYQNGLGVESDPVQAREYYSVAALAGVPLAQYNLGAMLVSARGGKRDYVEGLAWLILAARNHIEADGQRQVREHLANQPGVIAAAENRAEELARDVAARKGVKPPWPPPDPDSDAVLSIAPPPIEKPVISAPKLAPPKIELPPPPVFSPPAVSDSAKP
jgi:hypothetical protein